MRNSTLCHTDVVNVTSYVSLTVRLRPLFEGGSYFFALTLGEAIVQGRLLFKGGYYSMCGYYSSKYGTFISKCAHSKISFITANTIMHQDYD